MVPTTAQKSRLAWITSLLLLLCMLTAFAEDPEAAGRANLEEYGIRLEDALQEMQEAFGRGFGGFWLPYNPEGLPTYRLFDLTGDGCVDLCTCIMTGSGMVRTDLIVYDPVSHEMYILDGYNYDYLIDSVTEDRLVVVKRGPNGYGDPITETVGTVTLEEGRLLFTADEDSGGSEDN